MFRGVFVFLLRGDAVDSAIGGDAREIRMQRPHRIRVVANTGRNRVTDKQINIYKS